MAATGVYIALEPFSICTFFSGALLCNHMAYAQLHPLPTEQGLIAERLLQPYNVVCAYHPSPAGIRFHRAELFCWIKAFSAHSCHSGCGMSDGVGGGGGSGHGRNGRRQGEPITVWPELTPIALGLARTPPANSGHPIPGGGE